MAKLMYIVTGVMMAKEDVCSTVDSVQLVPTVEVKDFLRPRNYIKVCFMCKDFICSFYQFLKMMWPYIPVETLKLYYKLPLAMLKVPKFIIDSVLA